MAIQSRAESQNPAISANMRHHIGYGGKSRHIGQNWAWWRAQKPPPIFTMAPPRLKFDNTGHQAMIDVKQSFMSDVCASKMTLHR
jgi:hypothetical protein